MSFGHRYVVVNHVLLIFDGKCVSVCRAITGLLSADIAGLDTREVSR